MKLETIQNEHNTVLWHLVYRPFIDPKVKEMARQELKRRGAYGEVIEAIEEVRSDVSNSY